MDCKIHKLMYCNLKQHFSLYLKALLALFFKFGACLGKSHFKKIPYSRRPEHLHANVINTAENISILIIQFKTFFH